MNLYLLTNSMFGTKHLILLIASILIIVLASIFGRKLKMDTVFKILLIVGIISESIKVIYYILTNEHSVAITIFDKATSTYKDIYYNGYLPKTDLPFHLCSIQLIFIFILNLSNNDKLKKLLQGFMLPTCLIGGFAALAIPTSSSLNGSPILTLQYFGYHVAIIWFSIYMFLSKEITFTIKDYTNTIIMLFATFFIAIYLNSAITDYVHNVNFMYVVNPPADNLPLLNKNHGWGVYIIHYTCIALIAVTICYIKPIIKSFKKENSCE